MYKNRHLILTLSIITLGFISTNSLASGTYSPGGSSGNDYQMNKLIFYKKVTCNSCPFPGRGKSAQDAKALLQGISVDNTLSSREQKASLQYLQRRFKLN